MHDSRTVANRFLQLAKARGDALTPMQLLKLVYIAHGWMLGLAGRPLIKDQVQAWQYGPVIPGLYNALRHYRKEPISQSLQQPIGDVLDADEDKMVKEVDRNYGELSGGQLSNLTHRSGTPWYMTYRRGEFGIPIPDDLIKSHYERLAERRS